MEGVTGIILSLLREAHLLPPAPEPLQVGEALFLQLPESGVDGLPMHTGRLE